MTMLTALLGWYQDESCVEVGEDRMMMHDHHHSPQLAGIECDYSLT